MTFLGACASLFLKKASGEKLLYILKNKYLYLGGFLYVLTAGLNVFLLRYLDYSVMLPMTAITYIWTLLLANKVLKEHITKRKVTGVFLIFTGTIILICGH